MADKSDKSTALKLVHEDVNPNLDAGNYERMDPTNHVKLEQDKTTNDKELHISAMKTVKKLAPSAEKISFKFRTDIEELHTFYDQTLQEFLQKVDNAATAEVENQKKAKVVEEVRKKMQDLANERAKFERAAKEREQREKDRKTKTEEAAKAAAAKTTEAAKVADGKTPAKKDGEPDRPENKSVAGKSKAPAKQGVTSEPIARPGGDVPEDPKNPKPTEPAQPPAAATPADPNKAAAGPGNLGVPEEPKLVAKPSENKKPDGTAADPQQKKKENAADMVDQQKADAEEIEKRKQQEMQALKDLEASMADNLEQGMSRFTVAKLTIDKAQEFKPAIPNYKFSRFSTDGRYALVVTNLGSVVLFDTKPSLKKNEAVSVSDYDRKKFVEYARTGNKVFRPLHVLTKIHQFRRDYSDYSTSGSDSYKLDAIFSPDNTEIIIYDCYCQVILVYIVSEIMEHGFLVHPNYEAIRNINSLQKAQNGGVRADQLKLKYVPITNRKEGEPRYIIPLRGQFTYDSEAMYSKEQVRNTIKFMHFEKVVVGEDYFTPTDQDTLVIGTTDIVCRVLFSRFNQPQAITPKNDIQALPEVIIHQNKSFSEIFKPKDNAKKAENTDLSFSFTQGTRFYTQLKITDKLSSLTTYKFDWQEFEDNDLPRIRLKRMRQERQDRFQRKDQKVSDSLFVRVVSKVQIPSSYVLFPNTLSPSGQFIYVHNTKGNDIRLLNIQTGEQVRLLNIPPNRAGVSHVASRHQGTFLMVIDNDGWVDIYNFNNELVEKGSKYSLLYSFFGVVEPLYSTKMVDSANKQHDFRLADLLWNGTGVCFLNNLNLYHFELDLPESRIMPAVTKVSSFPYVTYFNRKLDNTYEILQQGDNFLQRIVDFGNGDKAAPRTLKPILQRTYDLEYGDPAFNFEDEPSDEYYVDGKMSFLNIMKENGDANMMKQMLEVNIQWIHSDCKAFSPVYEYEVSYTTKAKSRINFKLVVGASEEDGEYTILRLNDKNKNTLKITEAPVWKLSVPDDPGKYRELYKNEGNPYKSSKYAGEIEDSEDEHEYEESDNIHHLFWNKHQGMHNFLPINDDGTYFLVPVRPYLYVLSTDKPTLDKPFRKLPLLGKFGTIFWLSESLVGAVLLEDTTIKSDLFQEFLPINTELHKGLVIFDLATKEDVKFTNRYFKIRNSKDPSLLDHDLQNVQVYPSGYTNLRFFITGDEVLSFDTQKQMWLFNTANLREKQADLPQASRPQFMPNYVYKSPSYQVSRNNNVLALADLQNPTFVRLFTLPKLDLLEEITLGLGASNQPAKMCFSHDSKYFLTMTTSNTVSVYSVLLEKMVEPITIPEGIMRAGTILDINLVQESRFLEIAITHKSHYLIYRIPFYPEPRDLLLGALLKNFRSYHSISLLGNAFEQKKIASQIAALLSLQSPHQICLDNTLLKILCCHASKEPLEAYLNSLKDKEIIFKASQLDVLTAVHEQLMEDTSNDFLGIAPKKQVDAQKPNKDTTEPTPNDGKSLKHPTKDIKDIKDPAKDEKEPLNKESKDLKVAATETTVATTKDGSNNQVKGNLTNHVLNSFIDAVCVVHEATKHLPEISSKTIIKWLKSKSLSRRYRTKLIEVITFEPLNTVARGALQSDTGMVSLIDDKVPIEKTVKFVDTWSKGLMDPESANVAEFDAYITGIEFDLRNGSEFSLNYFQYLQEVSDEDLQLKYMGIIYYKWSQILYPATIYSILYWILNGLITAFMGFSHGNFGLGWAIIVLNVIFISYEVKGISYDWKESWKDPWNYYDTVTHTFTMITVMIFFKNPELTYDLSWLRLVSFVLISFRGVMMLRIFAGTRYLLVMLLEVFNEMVAFLSIFFWMVFGYWFMCLTRPSLIVGGQDLDLKDAIGQSLDIAFSNFNAGNLDTINLVTTVIGQILIALILLNYLISIVSKTSERISEERELYDIKMLLDIIREFDLVFNGFRSSKEARNARYLILRPRPTVDERIKEIVNLFEEEKSRLEGVFRQEVGKIEDAVIEKIDNFSSKIAETQRDIVELLKLINNKQSQASKLEINRFINNVKVLPKVVEQNKLIEADSKEKTNSKPSKSLAEEEEEDLYYHESSDDVASTDQEGSVDDSSEFLDEDLDDENQDEDEEDEEEEEDEDY